MRHDMRRNDNFIHARVSKDTVREENGLGELGKGLLIPAGYLSLFTFFMLILVTGDNFMQLFSLYESFQNLGKLLPFSNSNFIITKNFCRTIGIKIEHVWAGPSADSCSCHEISTCLVGKGWGAN